jgi:hypothetical protein
MTTEQSFFTRLIGAALALFLSITPMAAAQQGVASATVQSQSKAASSTQTQEAVANSDALPESPGALRAQAQTSPPPKASNEEQPNSLQQPAGTAAAQAPPPSGVTASKPAGIAIAPPEQHRTRSLLIKFGAVAGAGLALGTVFALSRGTSSVPPGAR